VTETDVICTANSNSQLDGLLTVFHTERSPDGLSNKQNDLPILCSEDKATLKALSREFEIDFVSLSFTRQAGDVDQAREYLKSIGLDTTKVRVQKYASSIALIAYEENGWHSRAACAGGGKGGEGDQ